MAGQYCHKGGLPEEVTAWTRLGVDIKKLLHFKRHISLYSILNISGLILTLSFITRPATMGSNLNFQAILRI